MRLWNSGNVPRRKVFIVIICSLLFVVILLSRGVYWTFKSYIVALYNSTGGYQVFIKQYLKGCIVIRHFVLQYMAYKTSGVFTAFMTP